jgi:hypothetical protein
VFALGKINDWRRHSADSLGRPTDMAGDILDRQTSRIRETIRDGRQILFLWAMPRRSLTMFDERPNPQMASTGN